MSACVALRGVRHLLALLCVSIGVAHADAGGLSLRWEILGHQYPEASGPGTTRAVLTLHNDGPDLPAGGWALYFNCASELRVGELPGHFTAEHLGGTHFRLRPEAGYGAVATGATLAIEIEHPEVVVKETRAPTGPYLVRTADPAVGISIRDYVALPPSRPEQEPRGQNGHGFRQTAADRYAANARIHPLPDNAYAPVLPTPRQWRWTGPRFSVTGMPRIRATADLAPEKALVEQLFAQRLRTTGAPSLPIQLTIDARLDAQSSEAYRLTASRRDGVRIIGKSAAGVARGVATLQQLLVVEADGVTLPSISIDDAPRFDHRGLHVDVARNFQPKEVIYRLLDLMARHKLNTLHFHLTDDEGWRLEVPGLPELTEVGARRGHSADLLEMLPPAHGSGADAADAHGSGYYTADDYVAILRHAADRRIRVIPEIEMPGHARAAVKAMDARARRLAAQDPEAAALYRLADPEDRSRYVSAQGFTDNVINPALPSTYRFIAHVLDAVIALHARAGTPLEVIHLGGDELPRGAWTDSPAIRQWMTAEQLSDRQAVWDRFYAQVADIAGTRHLQVAGWEEIAARRPAPRAPLEANPLFVDRAFTAFVWNDLEGAEDLGIRLANAGYPTVLAPVTAYYFDMVYNPNPEEPGATWAPPLGLEEAFRFDPYAYPSQLPGDVSTRTTLSAAGRAHLLGLEGTLWSETMREPARIEYLLLPRMLGLAERAWAAEPSWAHNDHAPPADYEHHWSVFMHQVAHVALTSLDADDAAAYRIAAPGLAVRDGLVVANHEYPGVVLRYTDDGQAPTASSQRYTRPLPPTPGLRFAAFDRRGRRGAIAQLSP